MESLNDSFGVINSCEEYKVAFTENLVPYQILALTVPLSKDVWTERDEAWTICFYVYIAVMSVIFLMLGLVSVVMLIKKDCIRLPTKTFFAIYMSTAIFGFSRALFLTLDPFGLVGFISDQFSAWFIVSRLLGAFGFPSLVASTTLMIFTLFKVVKAVPGKQWYHYWKFIILIMLVPYVIAFAAELIGNFTPYPGLLIVKICELLFAFWGLLMCITFLLAGNRLLRQLRLRGRKTVRISTVRGTAPPGHDMESRLATRQEFVSREQQRHQLRNKRITRKIAIITYGTALFTITYSLLSIASAIMVSFLLYVLCFGFQGKGLSAVWLAFEFTKRVNEIILTVVLLYSVTDVAGITRMLYGKCCRTNANPSSAVQSSSLQKNSSRTNILCRLERQDVESAENLNDAPYQQAFPRNENCSTIIENQDSNTQTNETAESPTSETTPQPLPIIILSQSSLNDAEVITEVTTEAQSTPEISTPDEIIESERRKTRNSRRSKKTVGTQTLELVDSAVQTEPYQSKPVPKPRRFKTKKSKNQVLNEQRIAALRQAPRILTSIHNKLSRKQTV